jgi:hypothetical protein
MLTILGTGCDPEVIAVPDLDWYTPVVFHQETKDWFQKNNPPLSVIMDLNTVLKNQKKYEALKEYK